MKKTKEMIEKISQELEMGLSREDCCVKFGIVKSTFYAWMKKSDFSNVVSKAEQRCKDRNIKIIQKAALKSWQAAAWWLERKHREEYARRSELTGAGGDPLIPVAIDGSDAKL